LNEGKFFSSTIKSGPARCIHTVALSPSAGSIAVVFVIHVLSDTEFKFQRRMTAMVAPARAIRDRPIVGFNLMYPAKPAG
jgi:hypothetical protein